MTSYLPCKELCKIKAIFFFFFQINLDYLGCIQWYWNFNTTLDVKGICSLLTFVLITHLYGFIMKALRIRKGRKVEDLQFKHQVKITFHCLYSNDRMWNLQYNRYTCANLECIHMRIWMIIFVGIHIPSLEVLKVHWPDDKCLSNWTWMPSLQHALE